MIWRRNIACSGLEEQHLHSFSYHTASSELNTAQLAMYYRRAGTSLHIHRHTALYSRPNRVLDRHCFGLLLSFLVFLLTHVHKKDFKESYKAKKFHIDCMTLASVSSLISNIRQPLSYMSSPPLNMNHFLLFVV